MRRWGPSLKGAGLGADWVVIGARSLLDMSAGSRLRDLVALRQGQECSPGRLCETAVIDLLDVYDEFSDGIEDPRAIRAFVEYALANWSPAPAFLVLVGDATRDYKNFFGYSPPRQFVPTQMFDLTANSQFGYYPSDTWFAAVVGSDAIPDLGVGRIPAHSLAEAEEVFRKIVAYEQGAKPASWAGRACLVSETGGRGADHLHGDPRRDVRPVLHGRPGGRSEGLRAGRGRGLPGRRHPDEQPRRRLRQHRAPRS